MGCCDRWCEHLVIRLEIRSFVFGILVNIRNVVAAWLRVPPSAKTSLQNKNVKQKVRNKNLQSKKLKRCWEPCILKGQRRTKSVEQWSLSHAHKWLTVLFHTVFYTSSFLFLTYCSAFLLCIFVLYFWFHIFVPHFLLLKSLMCMWYTTWYFNILSENRHFNK